jgi:sarcosine oxidase subunit alpha
MTEKTNVGAGLKPAHSSPAHHKGTGFKPVPAFNNLRIAGIDRREKVTIQVNGRAVAAVPGETVMAALTAAGFKALKKSNVRGEARGPFCGMGVCYECLVTINGVPKQRSCMTEVEANMEILIHEPDQS